MEVIGNIYHRLDTFEFVIGIYLDLQKAIVLLIRLIMKIYSNYVGI